MVRTFLSYSRKDEAIVVPLERDLSEAGLQVWFDKELSGGQAWWDRILQSIRECDCFLFALSPASLESEACKRESAYAAALGKPILPVLIADGVATKLLPSTLSMIHFIDYRAHDKQAFIALSKAVVGMRSASPLPEPLPAPPEVPLSYLSHLGARVGAPGPLSFEQQSALLVELKGGLRTGEDLDDIRQLLRELRRRNDLLATVAQEVDELLVAAESRVRLTPSGARGAHGPEAVPPMTTRGAESAKGAPGDDVAWGPEVSVTVGSDREAATTAPERRVAGGGPKIRKFTPSRARIGAAIVIVAAGLLAWLYFKEDASPAAPPDVGPQARPASPTRAQGSPPSAGATGRAKPADGAAGKDPRETADDVLVDPPKAARVTAEAAGAGPTPPIVDREAALAEYADTPSDLVPLGPDPLSKLEEFAVVGTGEVPSRSPTTGRYLISGETALILVRIPGGTFRMGYDGPGAVYCERPTHAVRIAPFYIAKTEVSRGVWMRVMAPDDPAPPEAALPVVSRSWFDAQAFLAADAVMRAGLRLPSEAEWEYACRAGNSGQYGFGNNRADLGDYAWYFRNSGTDALPANVAWTEDRLQRLQCRIHSIARKLPNAFGLYDMHGNAAEWCQDAWHDTYEGAPADGSPWLDPSGDVCVLRGGACDLPEEATRSSFRTYSKPAEGGGRDYGFRPARSD